MEFLRSHLHYHRASTSSLVRQVSAVAESECSQEDTADASEQGSAENRSTCCISMSRSSSPKSTADAFNCTPKARKRDANELDSAVLSFINRASSRQEELEDPAVGWFKSLLPMYNSLTAIEKLEFQSKVVLELRSLMLAKEQRMAYQSVPSPNTNLIHVPPRHQYSTLEGTSSSVPEYEYEQYYQN